MKSEKYPFHLQFGHFFGPYFLETLYTNPKAAGMQKIRTIKFVLLFRRIPILFLTRYAECKEAEVKRSTPGKQGIVILKTMNWNSFLVGWKIRVNEIVKTTTRLFVFLDDLIWIFLHESNKYETFFWMATYYLRGGNAPHLGWNYLVKYLGWSSGSHLQSWLTR